MVLVEAPNVSDIQPIGVPGTWELTNLRIPPYVCFPVGVGGVTGVVMAAVVVIAGLLVVTTGGAVVAAVDVGAFEVAAVAVVVGAVVVGDDEELQPLTMKTQTSKITRGIIHFLILVSFCFNFG
jgi:hypothetical protein